MIKQISQQQCILQICSKCLYHEIDSWMQEKWKELNEETKKQIYQELKSISLITGKCIVCGNSLISKNSPQKILKILKENKISESTIEEFNKSFCQ